MFERSAAIPGTEVHGILHGEMDCGRRCQSPVRVSDYVGSTRGRAIIVER